MDTLLSVCWVRFLAAGFFGFWEALVMKKSFGLCLVLGVGVALGWLGRGAPVGAAGGEGGGVVKCAANNGDVNADGLVNLSDAVTVLGHLFLGSPVELEPLCAAPPAASGLPATGQQVCYGLVENVGWVEVPCAEAACQGQDAQYATGCRSEGRFTDNEDGTVTDHCTGLMWQKDTADVNGDGQTAEDGTDALPWCDALAYCENLSFAGHDDWRLPNVRELQSIVDYGRLGPAIDPVFGAFSGWY
jgi:hypothetical protein